MSIKYVAKRLDYVQVPNHSILVIMFPSFVNSSDLSKFYF